MTHAIQNPPPTRTDGEILAHFLQHRHEDSFAELVRRHGSMVLGLCRSMLGSSADAEDAAQAVFLTLAQRAKSLTGRRTLAGWLHRVAWYIAAPARPPQSAAVTNRRPLE